MYRGCLRGLLRMEPHKSTAEALLKTGCTNRGKATAAGGKVSENDRGGDGRRKDEGKFRKGVL